MSNKNRNTHNRQKHDFMLEMNFNIKCIHNPEDKAN